MVGVVGQSIRAFRSKCLDYLIDFLLTGLSPYHETYKDSKYDAD